MKTKYFCERSFRIVIMTLLLLVAIPVTSALAGSSGPSYPGTAVTGGGNGSAWSAGNLVDVLGADDGIIVSAATDTENLNMTNFGFAIPTTATITGISVEINRWASGASVQDNTVQLLRGSAVGNDKASGTDWSTSDATVATYGNSTDLWGTTWTPAQINNSNFGVTLDVTDNTGSPRTASVDYVRITVTYKETPTLSVTNSPVTYDGTPKSAIVNASADGAISDIKYDGSSTVPTNAGTYAITADFTPSDTTNYNSLADASAGNFVIEKAEQATLTAIVTPSTVTYGSTAALSFSGGSGTGAVTFSAGASTGCSVSGTTLSVTNASGTCSITATKAADPNYLVATSAAAPVTLQKAATTTTVTGGAFTYDGAAHAATVSVTGPGGLNLTPSPSYSGSCSSAPDTVAEGTSCAAAYTYAGNNNYLSSSDSASVTITAKAASVTPDADSKVYGQSDPTLTGTLSGFLPADNVTATYSRAAGETVLGGPYTISAALSPAGVLSNYDITYNTANFTITAKAASVTPDADSKVYGSADPTFTGTLSGFLPADSVTATYSRETGESVLASPYIISAQLSPAGVLSNYNITYNTANFAITAKAASVTPNADSKVYGSADPALTGTLSGFLPADNVTAVYSREAGESVAGSPYTINAQLGPAGVLSNYNITFNTADFSITAAGLTISGVTAQDKIYDSTNTATLAGTAVLNGVVTGDTVDLSGTPVATFANANVGTDKPVTVSGFSLSGAEAGNYSLAQPTGLTASISAASVTVTGVTADNKVYDGDAVASLNTGSAAPVGVVPGDNVNLDDSGAAGVFADRNVGTGKVVTVSGLSLTGTDAGNYLLTQPTTTANITVKDLTVTATGVDKDYDGTTAAIVDLTTDALAGDAVAANYTSATYADKNVGPDKPVAVDGISISGADAGNYNLLNTTENTTASITPFDITVTAHAKTKFVGAVDPALTYSVVPGLFSGDTFTGALTRVAGETAGQYAILQGTLAAGSNYNLTFASADLTIASITSSNLDVYIGGALQESYVIAPSVSTRDSYIGVSNGPVKLTSTNDVPIMAAERVVYKVNNVNTSFTEMMGLPDNQLDTTYWLPWYNNIELDTQLRFANVSNSTATVHIYIGGAEMTGSPFTLGPGESTRKSFAGISNGPVKIVSDVNIVAAERVVYKVNGVNTSFTEMMGLPNSRLDTTYWFPWYNNVELDTQLRFANVTDQTATVHIRVGGVEMTGSPFTLGPGESTRKSFAGISNGPVKIESNVNIVAAERVVYKVNGVNTSFTEMMALPNSRLDTTYWFPWYNNVELDTQLRFANVTDQTATVHIRVGGVEMTGSPFTLGPGESTRKSFAGISGGPVKIVSDVNIVAAERVVYKVNGVNTSFSEMMGLPNSQLDSTYWLPWYNNIELDTQLRFGVP